MNDHLQKAQTWLLSIGHLIIDDGLDGDSSNSDKPIAVYLVIMALATRACPEKIVWLAVDFHDQIPGSATDFRDHCNSVLRKVYQNSDSNTKEPGNYYSVGILRRVMCCTENIFHAMHGLYSWHQDLQPMLGHKIQGPEVTVIEDLHVSCLFEAWKLLGERISEEVHRLDNKRILLQNVAVILDWIRIWDEPFKNKNYFLGKNQAVDFDGHDSYLAYMTSLIRNGREGSCPFISVWDQVSLLEWPIVIYGTCAQKFYLASGSYDALAPEFAYRSISRATSKLIIVLSSFDA